MDSYLLPQPYAADVYNLLIVVHLIDCFTCICAGYQPRNWWLPWAVSTTSLGKQSCTPFTATICFYTSPPSPPSTYACSPSPHTTPGTADSTACPCGIHVHSSLYHAYVSSHTTTIICSTTRLTTHQIRTSNSLLRTASTKHVECTYKPITIAPVPTTITATGTHTSVTAPTPSRVWSQSE